MDEYFVTVGPDGEIEIPAAIRESMRLVEGMRLGFQLDGPRIIVETVTNDSHDAGPSE